MLESKSEQAKLRRIVKSEIQNNKEFFETLLDREYSEYLQWIVKPTSWGGGTELFILAKYFKIEICVINIETLNHVIYGQDGNYENRIYILYSGIHYDAITQNIFEEMEEKTDKRIFSVDDEYAFEGAMFVASELRKKKQFTNLKEFSLICTNCFTGFRGQSDAIEHCKATGHNSFQESSDFAK